MKTQFQKGPTWRDENGYYLWESRKYPSVTTVLGPHDEFLWVHKWAIQSLVDELSAKVESGESHEWWEFDEIMGEWMKSSVSPDKAIKDGKYISEAGARFMKAAANRGSVCHHLIGAYAEGAEFDLNEIPEWVEGCIFDHRYSCAVDDVKPFAVNLWLWLESNKPTVWHSEVPVFNDTYGYAGTCDGIIYLDGKLWAFDCKTQNSYSAKRSHFAQVAAYARAEYIIADRDMKITSNMPTWENEALPSAVLYVTPEKCGLRAVSNAQQYFDSFFLPALKAFNAHATLPMPKEQTTWMEVKDGQ